MKVLEVLPYSSVGGEGRGTWEVETEEASGTAVSKVVGTSAAIWDVTKSSSILTLVGVGGGGGGGGGEGRGSEGGRKGGGRGLEDKTRRRGGVSRGSKKPFHPSQSVH